MKTSNKTQVEKATTWKHNIRSRVAAVLVVCMYSHTTVIGVQTSLHGSARELMPWGSDANTMGGGDHALLTGHKVSPEWGSDKHAMKN